MNEASLNFDRVALGKALMATCVPIWLGAGSVSGTVAACQIAVKPSV